MELDRFRNWMHGEGLSIGYMKGVLRHLRRVEIDIDELDDYYKIAEWLYEQEPSDSARDNFVKSINLYLRFKDINYSLKKTPRRGEPDIWVPTDEEARRIRKAVWSSTYLTNRNRLILDILFIAALRRNEVRKLKYGDFRTTSDKKIPQVTYHYIHVLGKGNKERFVDIPEELYKKVFSFKTFYETQSGFIFDFGKGRPLGGKQIGVICRQAGKATGAPQFHTHAARHYRAIELDAQGVTIDAIRRFLGHSDISTTQTYLRGRRNKTRDELVSKDTLFRGLRVKIESIKTASGESFP